MKRPLAMVALATAIVMMGLLVWYAPGPLEGLTEGEAVTLTGRVYDVQERDSYGTTRLWIYLDVESYHLICQTGNKYRPRLGSLIQVTGQFKNFSHATNPGQFDAQEYYATLNIRGMLQNAEIIAAGSKYSVVKEALYLLKNHWKERLYRYFPEKEASVLSAMLLGDRTQLNEGTKELYMQNGIIHILSISGLHITLLGMGLYKLLRRGGCPVGAAAASGGILILMYGMMTGMSLSAVRAIGMYLVRMLGELLGRTYDMPTALGCMGLVMLTGRPEYLGNVGFLLSFGSLCGIGVILPRLSGEREYDRRRYSKLQELSMAVIHSVRKAALPGVAVTLATLPIQLYYYYEVPVYSVILNLLVVPFMGIVMVVGMLVMIVPGMFWVRKADVLILGGIEWLCGIFEKLPNHTWNPGAPGIWQIIIYYLLLLLGIFGVPGRKKIFQENKILRYILSATVTVGAIILLGWRGTSSLSVTFLDVGQGDSIIVRTKEEVYLFDCGSSSESKIGEYVLVPYLKHEGIHHLDGVFVSHPDKDHVSGILELLSLSHTQGITIEKLVLPGIAEGKRESEFAHLLEVVAEMGPKGSEVIYMAEGTSWKSAEVSFSCLHPPAGSNLSDSNEYSQCFLVEYGEFSMLLTGDVEGEGEELLMQELTERNVGQVELLKVAHHGSRYSTREELLAILQPDVAVISCGENNSYGHPHEESLQRLNDAGSKILTTSQCGAITVEVGREVKIYGFQR